MKGWIPPIPLALGALIGALSWMLVVAYAIAPSFTIALAWIHAVALGSFTTIALAVLIHALPGFTDLQWHGEKVARWAGLLLPYSAVALVISFMLGAGLGVAIFGGLSALLVLAYTGAAIATVTQRAPTATESAIARAFLIVLVFLAVTAVLGAVLAFGYASGKAQALQVAPEHAAVGLVGWLTLLTMGVSARTFRPILGAEPRLRAMHIISNSAMLLCAIAIPLALAVGNLDLTRAAFCIGAAAAAVYAVDGFDRVRRASTPNPPAHSFIAAALVWLFVAAVCAALGAYGIAIVAALSGWLGQMVNAHLHHIGIRVIATTFGGEDNETRPWHLLDARLSWMTVLLSQIAVLLLISGVLSYHSWLFASSGCIGLCAVGAFAANTRIAMQRVEV